MTVRSLFQTPMGLQVVEVEVKTLPGVPLLHIVGQPDAHIKECGLRIKAALRSCGFAWPRGKQIVVNLRPTYLRKHSRGLELAIVVGILLQSEQLPVKFFEDHGEKIFYGEVGLGGEIFAPGDVADLIEPGSSHKIVTGLVENELIDGEWWSAAHLSKLLEPVHLQQNVDWEKIWRRPELPNFDFNEKAAFLLKISALMEMSTLLAGPQGSGKSTWARALYALTAPPLPTQFRENLRVSGSSAKWRAFESPHHTSPAKAIVGGGAPLKAGVITKAHGGVLVMDEFLEFEGSVLEALREPLETGRIHLNRVSGGAILPAAFQLIGTTNLCPCGKMVPKYSGGCGFNLSRCKSTWQRLSGPLLDRFEVMGFSHEWTSGDRTDMVALREVVDEARIFQKFRTFNDREWPDWVNSYTTFRRRRALARAARAIADFSGSLKVKDEHWESAKAVSTTPFDELRQLHG